MIRARIIMYLIVFINALYDYSNLSHTWFVLPLMAILIGIDLYEWKNQIKDTPKPETLVKATLDKESQPKPKSNVVDTEYVKLMAESVDSFIKFISASNHCYKEDNGSLTIIDMVSHSFYDYTDTFLDSINFTMLFMNSEHNKILKRVTFNLRLGEPKHIAYHKLCQAQLHVHEWLEKYTAQTKAENENA